MPDLLQQVEIALAKRGSAAVAAMTYADARALGLPKKHGPKVWQNLQRIIVTRRKHAEAAAMRDRIAAKLDDEERAWLLDQMAQLRKGGDD